MSDEALRRRRNIMIIGCMLLVGFILPVVGGGKVIFLNIQFLGERGVPGILVFMLLYPLLAGAAVLIVAGAAPVLARGITLIGLGVLPFLILVADENVQQGLGQISRQLGAMGMGALGFQLFIGYLAWIGLFVGTRARGYRPTNLVAFGFGAAGAGLYFLSLFIPSPGIEGPMGSSSGAIPLLAPFKMFEQSETVFIGIGLLVQMGCMIAAGVLCLMNQPRMEVRPAKDRARLAFRLFVGAHIAIGVAVLGTIMVQAVANDQPQVLGYMFLPIVKMVGWIFGLMLLVPVGISDLIVGEEWNQPVPARVVADPWGAPPPAPTQADTLRELKNLRDNGLISEDDYNRKKADILGRI